MQIMRWLPVVLTNIVALAFVSAADGELNSVAASEGRFEVNLDEGVAQLRAESAGLVSSLVPLDPLGLVRLSPSNNTSDRNDDQKDNQQDNQQNNSVNQDDKNSDSDGFFLAGQAAVVRSFDLEMAEIDALRIVLSCFKHDSNRNVNSDDNHDNRYADGTGLHDTVGVENVTLSLRLHGSDELVVWTDDQRSFTLIPQKPETFVTNALGRVALTFDAAPFLQEPHRWPIFSVVADNTAEITIRSITPLLHAMASIQNDQLEKLVPTESGAAAVTNNANMADVLRQLLEPVLHADLLLLNDSSTSSPFLHKRSFSARRKPFLFDTNTDRLHTPSIPRGAEIKGYTLSPLAAQHTFWEWHHEDGFVPHRFSHLRKRSSVKRSWYLDRHLKMIQFRQRLVKRDMQSIKNKLDETWDTVEDVVDHVSDFVSLKAKEIADRVFHARSMVVSSHPDGLQLTLVENPELGVANANKTGIVHTVLKSIKDVFAAIGGVFKKIGIKIRDAFAYFFDMFNWEEILLNHKVITNHYAKMVAFMRQKVTDTKEGLSKSLQSSIKQTRDILLGLQYNNFTELKDILYNANQSLWHNLTTYQPVPSSSPTGNANGMQLQSIQSSFMTDHFMANIEKAQTNITEDDLSQLKELTQNAYTELNNGTIDTIREWVRQGKAIIAALRQGDTAQSSRILKSLAISMFDVVLNYSFRIGSRVFDFIIRTLNRILSQHIYIPFVTPLWEKHVLKSEANMTLYEVYALVVSVPLTTVYKGANNQTNLLTKEQANVVLQTKSPDQYVDNLVEFDRMNGIQDTASLRLKYRRIMSYYLGAPYAHGVFHSSWASRITNSFIGVYLIRAPNDFLAFMCNFPWSWYTDTVTEIGFNFRFLGWFAQFSGFVLGFPFDGSSFGQYVLFSIFRGLAITVPQLLTVYLVLSSDKAVLRAKTDSPPPPSSSSSPTTTSTTDVSNVNGGDGYARADVFMKATARFLMSFPEFWITLSHLRPVTSVVLKSITIFGAGLQVARLYAVDIQLNAIYSA